MSIDTHEPSTPQDPSEFWAIAAGAAGDKAAPQAISPNEEQVNTNQASSLEDSSQLGATTPQADSEQAPTPTGDGSYDEVTAPAAPVAGEDKKFWTTPKKVLASVVTTALVGGGVGAVVAANGSNSKAKAAASHSQSHGTASKHPTTVPSQQNTPTSLPSATETTTTGNGNEYSAGNLDPYTPVTVSYEVNHDPNKADAEKLVHNIAAAVSTDNIEVLLYSGIEPNSPYAQNLKDSLMATFNAEKAQHPDLITSWQLRLYDKDVWIDPSDPTHVKVMVDSGSNFDLQYFNDNCTEWDFHLAHGPVTLPNGNTVDIWGISGDINVSPIQKPQWVRGYTS